MTARYGIPPAAVALVALLGCGGRDRAAVRDTAHVSTSPAVQSHGVQPDSRPAIVFLGTSLTAGYGLPDPSLAFPALIQAKLDSAGRRFRVVNAGISGESSAGALSRIDWLLTRDTVAVLVVETGANDGLRGQEPDSVRARIQGIFDRARRANTSPPLGARRDGGAAHPGRDLPQPLPRPLPLGGPRQRRGADSVSPRGRGRRGLAQPGRPDSPDRGGGEDRGGECVEGAGTGDAGAVAVAGGMRPARYTRGRGSNQSGRKSG